MFQSSRLDLLESNKTPGFCFVFRDGWLVLLMTDWLSVNWLMSDWLLITVLVDGGWLSTSYWIC